MPDTSRPYFNRVAQVIHDSGGKIDKFIGDAVNTAARLESLTREVAAPILVFQDMYRCLGEDRQRQLQPLGAHQLKGRAEPVPVYGLSA